VVFADSTYRLGGSSFELANAVLSARQRKHLNDDIRAGMKALNDRTGETVLYGILTSDDPPQMTYVELVESRGAIRISVGIGDRGPLYCTAGGRILLAGMSDDEVRHYLATTPLASFTPATQVDPAQLLESVRDARRDRFSCVVDEMRQGITGLAAPVMDSPSNILGALIVAGPTGRIEEAVLRSAIHDTARQISAALGHRDLVGAA
jgi:DNA-binding IclR family transcriptional regulator